MLGFFEKNNLFPYRNENNKISSNKLNIKICSSFSEFFEALFLGSYKGLQITQKLTCIEHVDLLLSSTVLNVNHKIRKIHIRIFIRTNCCICSIGS